MSYRFDYLDHGYFPTKCNCMEGIVKKVINQTQIDNWKASVLMKPDFKLYSTVHTEFKSLNLWSSASRHPLFLKAISNMVNIFCGNVPSAVLSAVNSLDTGYNCKQCGKSLTDISNHFIMDCPITTAERNKLWDLLQDRLPVTVCAQLFNNDEGSIYTNLFSGNIINNLNCMRQSNVSTQEMKDTFLLTVAQGFLIILDKVANLGL